MTHRRFWIALGLALFIAPGCGLQHVAEWMVSKSADGSGRAAPQPIAQPPAIQQPVAQQTTQQPAVQPPTAQQQAPAATVNASANSVASTPAPSSSATSNNAGASRSSQSASNSSPVGLPVRSTKDVSLRYGFKDGQSYHYRVHIEAELPDGSKQINDGTCVYTVKVSQAKPVRKTSAAAFKPTATAFVVSSDGYLVTCHHVVDDAEKLEVAVAGQTYTARVIETDAANDLAIIKIDATGLKTVPLADSDRVEVGQEVRAIGFPLSSILGDSLKATRGTVSGIENRNGRHLLQVDASINPGNSGGPLVSERGDVVGIASAKLAGSSISNVGFAVPVNEAKRLLARHNVQIVSRQNTARLEGPALVRGVSPAVALVTIASQTIDPRDGEQIALKFTNTLSSHERQARPSLGPPRFPRMRPPFSPFETLNRSVPKNEVVIDPNGNILEASGGESLPFMLGNLALLMLEPLPSDGERDWQTERTCTIHEKKTDDNGSFGPGFIRPPTFGRFGPRFGDEEEVIKHPASEVTEYSIGEPEGDKLVITKAYELKTEAEVGKQPYLQLTGDGEITFDIEQGIPLELSYEGTVQVSKQNVSVRIPLTVSYKLLDAETVAKEKATAEARAAEAKAKADEAKRPKPLAEGELPKLLTRLKSADNFDRRGALDRLALAIPEDDKRAEVAEAIVPLAGHNDTFTRQSALKALTIWGSESQAPAIIEQLGSADVFTRNAAMSALGTLKDHRAIAPLCERFKNFQDRGNSSSALEKFGSAAEKEVLKLLDEQDWHVRMSAAQLLAKIGTADSLAALEAVLQDSNGLVKGAARSAIDAINQR